MRNARTILTKREASDFIVSCYLLKHPVEAFRTKKKRFKERGSPCLIPRDGLMFNFGSPLTNIEYDTCVVIDPLQDGPWAKDWRGVICWAYFVLLGPGYHGLHGPRGMMMLRVRSKAPR